MTAEESIKIIKQHFYIYNDGRLTPLLDKVVQNAIAALELRVPARPNLISDGDWDGEPVYDTWECPNCSTQFEVEYEQHSYCPDCGKKIKWDGVFEE